MSKFFLFFSKEHFCLENEIKNGGHGPNFFINLNYVEKNQDYYAQKIAKSKRVKNNSHIRKCHMCVSKIQLNYQLLIFRILTSEIFQFSNKF